MPHLIAKQLQKANEYERKKECVSVFVIFLVDEEMLVYKYDEMKMNGSIEVKYNRVRCLLLAEIDYASLIMRWSSQRHP